MEYTDTSENGFEIIHKQRERIETPVQKNITPEVKQKEEVVNKVNEVSEVKKESKVEKEVCTERKPVAETVTKALNDAVLPSKSPLPVDDPFNFLTSSNYMTMFLVASTTFVFLLGLFD